MLKICRLDVLRLIAHSQLGASLDMEPEGNGSYRVTVRKYNGEVALVQLVRPSTHNDDFDKAIRKIDPTWDGELVLV